MTSSAPIKLPSYENEFGADGNAYFSVRQTRFGVKSEMPTSMGALKTLFEFELFGTGADAGQTTFACAMPTENWDRFGAGQTWSPFMDIDVFPNSVEYWGPNGMVFFRNVQVRWMPAEGRLSHHDCRGTARRQRRTRVFYRDRIELQDVRPHFPMPDISGEARLGRKWGYIEVAGILRAIGWEDMGTTRIDLSGHAWGWGVNLSSNLKVGKKDTIKLQLVYGEGIQNYMNDAPEDIGIKNTPGNLPDPVKGVALPLLGIVAFYDHYWSDKFSSTIGYSRLDIDNSSGQADDAFMNGQYAVTNLLYYPVKNAMMGGEFQWEHRKNFRDGWGVPDYRIQFSFKYNFSFRVLRELAQPVKAERRSHSKIFTDSQSPEFCEICGIRGCFFYFHEGGLKCLNP